MHLLWSWNGCNFGSIWSMVGIHLGYWAPALFPSYPGHTPPPDKPTSWKVAWPSPAKWSNTTCVWTWVSRSDSIVIVGDVCALDSGQLQCSDQFGGDQLCSASTIIHVAHARQKPMVKDSTTVKWHNPPNLSCGRGGKTNHSQIQLFRVCS